VTSGVIFESAARPLLLAHAVLAFAALFSSTHHAAHAVLSALGRLQQRELRRFGWIAPLCLVAQALVGLALYPTYRVHVRAPDFDRTAPLVAQLFDFKEHLAALALALVIAAAIAGAAQDRTQPRAQRWTLATLSLGGAAMLWTATLIGLYVTARHPV
jgi:cytochrome bd-type quinol oxidase subunit 2